MHAPEISTPAAPVDEAMVPERVPTPVESHQSEPTVQPDAEPETISSSHSQALTPVNSPSADPVNVPVPEDDFALMGQAAFELPSGHGWQYQINLGTRDLQKILESNAVHVPVLLATAAKRQRSEVRMSELAPEDKAKFDQAKLNEINQWLDTGTVQKILRYKIPPEQILRCRWALTWKTPEPGSTSGDRRAKARLVVLGYEDPQIDAIPRDSPTLSKDSRMLVPTHRISSVDC